MTTESTSDDGHSVRKLRAENARLRAAAANAAYRISNLLMPIGGALDVAKRRCDDLDVRGIIDDALIEVDRIAALATALERDVAPDLEGR